MKGADRAPWPSLPMCPQCGTYIFPRPTPLQLAEHDVAHAEWQIRDARARHQGVPPGGWAHLAVVYRKLEVERHNQVDRLKTRVCDLEEAVANYEFDLSVANKAVADLKADVDELAAARARHPANQAGTDG